MRKTEILQGVFGAALTPINPDGSPALGDLPGLLGFLAQRGCHGALLLGTTGEGPSMSPRERVAILRAALEVQQEHPHFRIMVGTGFPSLDETVELTRTVFDLGADGVVTLPPYYYRKVGDDGLFAWFDQVLERAVPEDGALFGYHIPSVSGVPLSLELLARLKDAHPDRFFGIKDSSSDLNFAQSLGERFGKDLLVYNGNDRLFKQALDNQASGCITAMANLVSPDLRRVWESHRLGKEDAQVQNRLDYARTIMERYPPAPPLLKPLMSHLHNFPRWAVRLPLLDLLPEIEHAVLADVHARGDVFGTYN